VLRRVDAFLAAQLPKAIETRQERAGRLLELDDRVNEAVAGLKERGFVSPYLKAFVVARVNPLRFKRGATMPFDEALDKMLAAARRFDPVKVQIGDLAGTSGPPAED
jgi:ParB family transcriptional regulator, chromosome partitioning protein